MNPELLPLIAAIISMLAFLFTRLALRGSFGRRPADLAGATAAAGVYYGLFLYRNDLLTGMRVPDGGLTLALLATVVLLAISFLFPHWRQHSGQSPPASQSRDLGTPPGRRNGEATPSSAQTNSLRLRRSPRLYYPSNRSSFDHYARRPSRPDYPDDTRPEDERLDDR